MTVTPLKSSTDRPKKGKPGASKGRESGGGNVGENIIAYFKGVRQEWDKITWPTRERVIAETGVVLVVVAVFSVAVYIMDWVFQKIIQLIT